MRLYRALPLALLLVVPSLPAAPAAAATLEGVTLPDHVDAGGQSLVLDGMGLRKKFFIRVYVGGLYLPSKESDAGKVLTADAPRRMVFDFLYSVSKDQMCDAWKEGLEDNTPRAPAAVKKAFDTLCAWMEAIPKGHTMAFTYLPGTGTEVEVNGKKKGNLEGKPVADAILATWLGPKPGPGDDFKKAVLGK